MSDRPARLQPRALTATRRAFVLGGVAVLSGCSLRLEKGSHLPGPTATKASDIAPLQSIRTTLSDAATAAATTSSHTAQARPVATLHRLQLQHLDATLKGLGAAEPTESSESPATASSSSASSAGATNSAAGSPSSTAAPSASSSGSAKGKSSDWVAAEKNWISPSTLHTITTISAASRPMTMCAAATGLAALDEAGSAAPWSSDSTFPAQGANQALTASSAAIDALQWMAARTDPTKRGSTPDALTWLYAVQGMAQAAAPVQATSSPSPVRRYADDNAAKKVAVTAIQDLLPACARAAQGVGSTQQVQGVMLAWSKSIRELRRLGSPDRTAFPGLNAGS